MFFDDPFRRKAIASLLGKVWPFSNWSRPRPRFSSEAQPQASRANQSAVGGSVASADEFSTVVSFWNCGGTYIGFRAFDGLFRMDGHQIGYFAEGNEIYGCHGKYLGEV